MTGSQDPSQPKDPMKSFRGIVAGSLIMEAITVGLALLFIAKVGGGMTSPQAWVAMAVVVALIALCGFVRKPWITAAILGLQLVLIAFFFTQVAVGIIGVIFLAAWLLLFRMRNEVARRMAAGTLPSQQQ